MATKNIETHEDLAKAFADMAKLEVESVSIQIGMPVVKFLAGLLATYCGIVARVKTEEAAEKAKPAEEENPQ